MKKWVSRSIQSLQINLKKRYEVEIGIFIEFYFSENLKCLRKEIKPSVAVNK